MVTTPRAADAGWWLQLSCEEQPKLILLQVFEAADALR